MSQRAWWTGLAGIVLALIGIWGAWVPHRAVALVLSGWDLAEFVKFVPGASATRELFYLPVWCTSVGLGMLAGQSFKEPGVRRATGVISAVVAAGLMVAILPPYPDLLTGFQSSEFRWQFTLGCSGAFAVLTSLFSGRWSARAVGGLLVGHALVGTVPALWHFLKVRGLIQAVYGTSLGWGWGTALFLAGWGLVAATGARLLMRLDEEAAPEATSSSKAVRIR